MMTSILYKGEDKPVVFELEDKQGNPVDFADLVDVIAVVRVNNVQVDKFKKVAATGYKSVLAVTGADNQCKILLKAADTKLYNEGLLEIEFTMVLADADFVLGRKETEVIPLFMVRENKTGSL